MVSELLRGRVMKTNKIDKPRFVIGDSPKSRLITKSKYSTLTKLEKLQIWLMAGPLLPKIEQISLLKLYLLLFL
jgi:hypothetical protein